MYILNFIIALFFLMLIPNAFAMQKNFSNIDAQIAVEVTVYNSNLGLVKDQRDVKLSVGLQELQFMDVASQIIPTSVSIRSTGRREGFKIIEQNYEYDLISPQRLLNKYVGKDVKLYSKNPYTDKEEIISAKIISNNDGNPVFQIGKDITFGHPGRIVFPEIPENLISKPTLIWLIDNQITGTQRFEVRYLTNGINWRASYVMVLNEKDDMADLSGWVTIDNKSGATYKNARLKLIAGDINRVDEIQPKRDKMPLMALSAEAKTQFAEQEFFEYHIYTLDRTSDLKDNQTKQISLLDVNNISVIKSFIFSGAQYYYRGKYGEIISNQKVPVFIEIQNNKQSNLGIPLPKGIIRVYKYDHDKSLQLIGENTIDHTPKNEKIKIKLGDAFDIIASKKQTEWQKITDKLYEAAFEISIRNHKKEDIVVKVIESIPGDWRMLQSSHEYKKNDAYTISFDVPVAKDKETKLTYRVSMKF